MSNDPPANLAPAPDASGDNPAPTAPAADLTPLVRLAAGRPRVVAFTGAGISTDSGIPDYRGPNGVWRRQNPLTIQAFLRDPEIQQGYWERRRTGYSVMADAAPNRGHLALAALERAGLLQSLITQNIDGLHQKAGNDPARIIELHGTTHTIYCLTCGTRYSGAEIQAWLQTNDGIPTCAVCGGTLRPATILFGESLDDEVWQRAVATVQDIDLLLVVGSSLVVSPASSLPRLARQRGAAVAIINRDPTPLDGLANVVIHGDAGPVLSELTKALLGAAPG